MSGTGDPSETDRDRVPVDTLTAPHEPRVASRSTRSMWAIVLSGPALVIVHFGVVYLAAEASCAAEESDQIHFFGSGPLVAFVVVATVVGVALALAGAWWSQRRGGAGMYRIGWTSSLGAALTILAVGIPVLVLAPC